MYQSIDRLIHS